ncbi:MAG: nucleotidyltransferase domain-containing protein [Planctomycetota bacterium]|nr:nucleotidyltransferase domain-containing protein [Planctomycetota bacterium]
MVPLIRDNLDAIIELCRQHKVRRLFLIGSATGEGFDPDHSDVDFLVEFEPHESAGYNDDYFQLLEGLKAVLGREVDLIEAHAQRNPYLIASLNRTKKVLYAA